MENIFLNIQNLSHIWALEGKDTVYSQLAHFRKPSAPRSLPPNHQDWNVTQGIRNSKTHLECNPLGTLNLTQKILNLGLPGSWDRQKNIVRNHKLLLISPWDNNTKLHSEPAAGNWSFMRVAQCATCISWICLPFHKGVHGGSQQGTQTQRGLISIAMELPADLCCKSLVSNCTEPPGTAPLHHPGEQHLLQSSCPNPPW